MADMLHDIVIDAALEHVYDALTRAGGLRGWWTADAEADATVGSAALFGFGHRTTVFRMRIDLLEPPSRVVWTCLGEPDEWTGTTLSFVLEQHGTGGTRLRFTHAGWRRTDSDFATCNSTWGALMHRLRAYAEGRNPGPHFTGT